MANGCRICFPDLDQDQWSYNRTMERVLFKEAYRVSFLDLFQIIILITTALVNIPKPYRLPPVHPLCSLKRSTLTNNSTTMDSGPNGDSFLAPRMLPDPDEGGDYRWPSACILPPHLPLSSTKRTNSTSHPPHPYPNKHNPLVLRLLSNPNRPQATLRNRNLRRSPDTNWTGE